MTVRKLFCATVLLMPFAAFAQAPAIPALMMPMMPDPSLTPGLSNDPPTPLAKLCNHTDNPTKDRRKVSAREKRLVMKAYGISLAGMSKDDKKAFRKTFEIDHLIPLALDGRNGDCKKDEPCDIRNLWPQSYILPHNAHQKDRLEDKLMYMVCNGQVPLAQAQHELATDWWAAYQKYVGE